MLAIQTLLMHYSMHGKFTISAKCALRHTYTLLRWMTFMTCLTRNCIWDCCHAIDARSYWWASTYKKKFLLLFLSSFSLNNSFAKYMAYIWHPLKTIRTHFHKITNKAQKKITLMQDKLTYTHRHFSASHLVYHLIVYFVLFPHDDLQTNRKKVLFGSFSSLFVVKLVFLLRYLIAFVVCFVQ